MQAGEVTAEMQGAVGDMLGAIREQRVEIDADTANTRAMREATVDSARSAALTGFAAGKLEQTMCRFRVADS